MNNERLGHILLKQGLVDAQQLDFCLSVQKNNGQQRLGVLLAHYNFVNELSIAKALASQVGWGVYEGEYQIDLNLVEMFGSEFLIKNKVCPVVQDDRSIFVMSRSDDTSTTDLINQGLQTKAIFCIGIESQLRKALDKLCEGQVQSLKLEQHSGLEDNLLERVKDIIGKAVVSGASDIHIEPSSKVVEIRFRIDGVLVFTETLPIINLSRLVNVIFHLADVTISDFTHFHDAKFLYKHLNRDIDIRVSHIPSVYGSAIVLRLLDKSKSVMELSELGFNLIASNTIRNIACKPNGICLIVGPTGCGKTTTLYAILNSLKSIDNKILTIEDPVEVQLPLITQVQVNEKRGITFPQSIRAFLRHDPDIILVGEIRDQLTAQEALRAAMTGHQVFSTLHTNKAVDVFYRLHDLGIPFVHMADHVSMIISQRLVRKICQKCKSIGCESCSNGYKGQTVVSEIITMNEPMVDLLSTGDILGLKKYLKNKNHQTMLDDARRLISEGVTSIQEVKRILGE